MNKIPPAPGSFYGLKLERPEDVIQEPGVPPWRVSQMKAVEPAKAEPRGVP